MMFLLHNKSAKGPLDLIIGAYQESSNKSQCFKLSLTGCSSYSGEALILMSAVRGENVPSGVKTEISGFWSRRKTASKQTVSWFVVLGRKLGKSR